MNVRGSNDVIDRKWTKRTRKKKKIKGNELVDKMQSTLLRLCCEGDRSEQRREGKPKQVQKKERLCQSQGTKKELPNNWLLGEDACVFLRILLGLGRLDSEE